MNKMKANNGKGNNESRDDWETPKWLFDKLNKQYIFNFDCCASENNKKCIRYTSRFDKCFFIGEDIICWMNPPFSKSKKMFEQFFKLVYKGVAIYRCDNMETKVWQDIILRNADWIFIPSKRIAYEGKNGKGSRFPSALIGIGVEPPIDMKGVVLFVKK